MPFTFHSLRIPDVKLIEPRVFGDERGFFMETYKESEFIEAGIPRFVQDNRSRSAKGVLRGLHFQLDPVAQGKLVTAVAGSLFDVAVDIRKGSPTYGEWVGEMLTEENRRFLYVPEGFAHGFCVVSDSADVAYKTTAEYAPALERGFAWNDPSVAVDWPVSDPILSDRDAAAPPLERVENTFSYPS